MTAWTVVSLSDHHGHKGYRGQGSGTSADTFTQRGEPGYRGGSVILRVLSYGKSACVILEGHVYDTLCIDHVNMSGTRQSLADGLRFSDAEALERNHRCSPQRRA